jgi:hypothetical protein
MGYFISNIDNEIHNTSDVAHYVKDNVVYVLDQDSEEIDACTFYPTRRELIHALVVIIEQSITGLEKELKKEKKVEFKKIINNFFKFKTTK